MGSCWPVFGHDLGIVRGRVGSGEKKVGLCTSLLLVMKRDRETKSV